MHDMDCECICNHAGACTGCGICWLEAYWYERDRQIRALFAFPGPDLVLAERCCVCGSADVGYHNYRDQPFCWPCADGEVRHA